MNFAKGYLLFGSDDYLIEREKKRLLEALFCRDKNDDTSGGFGAPTTYESVDALFSSGDMNFNRFTGPAVDMDEMISAISTMPFFSKRRVVLVEESGFFASANERLLSAIESIPDTTVVIFAEKKVDKRLAAYKHFSKNLQVRECNMLTGSELERWAIGEMLGSAGLKITRDAWQTFLNITTTDKAMTNMSYMSNELNKLISYCHGKESVGVSDVKAIVSGYFDDSIFALLDCIAASDVRGVMTEYDKLILANVEPERIIHMIIWEFQRILSAGELYEEGMSYSEIASRCNMQDWQIKKHAKSGHFKSFPPKRAFAAIEKAADFQYRIRNGSMDAKIGCELLINELITT